jgi:hypothetical protein
MFIAIIRIPNLSVRYPSATSALCANTVEPTREITTEWQEPVMRYQEEEARRTRHMIIIINSEFGNAVEEIFRGIISRSASRGSWNIPKPHSEEPVSGFKLGTLEIWSRSVQSIQFALPGFWTACIACYCKPKFRNCRLTPYTPSHPKIPYRDTVPVRTSHPTNPSHPVDFAGWLVAEQWGRTLVRGVAKFMPEHMLPHLRRRQSEVRESQTSDFITSYMSLKKSLRVIKIKVPQLDTKHRTFSKTLINKRTK